MNLSTIIVTALVTPALLALEAGRSLPPGMDAAIDPSPFSTPPRPQQRISSRPEDEKQPHLSDGLQLTPPHARIQIVLDRKGVTLRVRLAR